MVPGLALWLSSGYSYGAGLLTLAALCSLPMWVGRPVPRDGWWLVAAFSVMLAVWLLDTSVALGWRSLDKPSKYLFALPCLFYALAFAPRAAWLWCGLVVGACGSGMAAIYQTQWLALPRAEGFTNAIQYGDLSLLLGMMCGAVLWAQWTRRTSWQRLAWGLGVLLGGVGSVLSESRGGWLALLLIALPLCCWLLAQQGRRRAWLGAGLLLVGAALLLQTPAISHRIDEAWQEVGVYESTGDAATSVGQRLAHWKLAWSMGLERPWTGWGRAGYAAEKARRVAAHQVHPIVLQFGHAHNELLDLFAKHGLPGVLALLVFYGVPLTLFWPSRARIMDRSGKLDREVLSLRLVGVLLPVSYVGFGLTQVFFAHNSGNMFYLFMCVLVLAALRGRRCGGEGGLTSSPSDASFAPSSPTDSYQKMAVSAYK